MANNGREGEGFFNVNVAGNSAHPGSSANPNIHNSNTMIQWPGRQGQAVHNVNGAGNNAYPGSTANSNIQNSNTMIQGQKREGQGVNNVNVAGNSANPGNIAYPNIQNRSTMIQGQGQDQDQSRSPYGYNQAWYPRAPNNMLHVQPDYTYPNPALAMDMDMNMNSYNHRNYYHLPPTDGRFHPLQSHPQLPVQPEPRAQPVFDAGRRGRSSRHSSGRNSNTLQAAGRGRGRVLGHNNYSNETSSTQVLGNFEEFLMRLRISEGEMSTQRQGQGHAKPSEHANTDAVNREYWNAKFFVIKSCSRENVVSSIKHRLWTSTPKGNRILNAAYKGEAHHEQSVNASCPVFLFFSVQGSGNFCGVAQMDGPVDFDAFAVCWNGDWKGKFPVKWHTIKDVPYSQFRHITYSTLGNPDQISIVYCRDTQQLEFEKGLEMLGIFKTYVSNTSLLDDASTSTASPQNNIDNQRWKINYKREGQDQDQEGKEEEDQNQEEQAEVEDKQKGKEKEEEDCEQHCIGSAICDIISANQIKQQDTIEDSPSDMHLQEIVNTEEMQQGHVETNNEPPKATVDTDATTQVTEGNTGYTNQIMTPP